MKDLIIGLFVGFAVGVSGFYLVDGAANRAARAAATEQQSRGQAQIDMLSKLCPDVLSKLQASGVK